MNIGTRMRGLGLVLLLALLPAGPRVLAAEAAAQLGPQELMNDVSTRMFQALDANRAAVRKDAEKVFPLVDKILLPHFDTEYAAQQILAQNWRKATPEQQKRFISALYNALLHTYGNALGEFTADRLTMLPFRGDLAASSVMVRTQVRRASGSLVAVDYRMHKTADGWKAVDVIIEGISYVHNYRVDLGSEVDQKGLEEMISRLEKEGLNTDLGGAGKPKPAAGH